MPSAGGGPHAILHCSLHDVHSHADSCSTDASAHVSGMGQCPGGGALGDSGSGGHANADSAHAHSSHDDPPWDSHEHNSFWSS